MIPESAFISRSSWSMDFSLDKEISILWPEWNLSAAGRIVAAVVCAVKFPRFPSPPSFKHPPALL